MVQLPYTHTVSRSGAGQHQRPEDASGGSRVGKQARSHIAVAIAIKQGRLVRGPCEVCGAVRTDAHHDDYDKPLDVRWLCRLHHRQTHVQGPFDPVSLGIVTTHQLRDPYTVAAIDEPLWIVRMTDGMWETIGMWVPLEYIDE